MVTEEFTNASLQGTYAITGMGWGGQAAMASIGTLGFDGKGKVSGLLLQSIPGDVFGQRELIENPFAGTYQVNANGTGNTLSTEGGDIQSSFAITRAATANDCRIAQEFSLILRELDPSTGCLHTAVATKLPESGEFNNASLKGVYVGAGVGRGGQTPAAGFGIITYDGNGGFVESNIANIQGETFRDRRFVRGSDQGRYAINPDGTGTVAGGGVVFVITKARLVDSLLIAEEYAFFVRELAPPTGAFFTGVTRRLSD